MDEARARKIKYLKHEKLTNQTVMKEWRKKTLVARAIKT
jgi:hypothetical protein